VSTVLRGQGVPRSPSGAHKRIGERSGFSKLAFAVQKERHYKAVIVFREKEEAPGFDAATRNSAQAYFDNEMNIVDDSIDDISTHHGIQCAIGVPRGAPNKSMHPRNVRQWLRARA